MVVEVGRETFVVVSDYVAVEGKTFVFGAKKSPPFSEKVKIINTKENLFSSLCQMDEEIFICDSDFEEIVCFSKVGKKIKTVKVEKSLVSASHSCSFLRADPTTGNLLGACEGMAEIFVFNKNGQILQKVKTEEEICDFCADQFGQIYFCKLQEIFSLLPEKKLVYKFSKTSDFYLRKIFVSRKKFFVCFENDAENLMKIFKLKEKL